MSFSLKRTMLRLRQGPALGGCTRPLLARSSHHMGRQAQRAALERQMLLEQAVEKDEKPLGRHPEENLSYQERDRRETLELVRGVNARVDAARRAALHATPTTAGGASPSTIRSRGALDKEVAEDEEEKDSTHDVSEIVSFPQFLLACKQYRVAFGSSPRGGEGEDNNANKGELNRGKQERFRRRKEFVRFWNHHVGSAMLYCRQRQNLANRGSASEKSPDKVVNDNTLHDFCFICFHGLSDDRLHMDLAALQIGLQCMTSNKLTCSCAGMMAALQYVTRELAYIEKQAPGNVPSDLQYVKRTLADLCLERIVFFFVLKAPQHSRRAAPHTDGEDRTMGGSGFGRSHAAATALTTPDGDEGEEAFTAALGTADDALAALEVLARLPLQQEASPALVQSLEGELRRLFAAKQATGGCLSSDVALREGGGGGPQREVKLTHAYLVSELFYFIMLSARRNQFVLHQVQKRGGGDANASPRMHKSVFKFTSLVQCFALLRIYLPILWPPYARQQDRATGSKSTKASANLQREQKLLQKISDFLAKELMLNDSHFVNSYHFTKIMICLARLPGTVLCPDAPTSRDQRRTPAESVPSSFAEMLSVAHKQDAAPTAVQFWQYMVSKAVIFVSNLPPEHRRLVCEQLYICIKQKRGRQFGQPRHQMPGRGADVGGSNVLSGTELLPTAENILFPLVAEMSQYKDNYDACIRTLRTRKDGRRMEGRSGFDKKKRDAKKKQ